MPIYTFLFAIITIPLRRIAVLLLDVATSIERFVLPRGNRIPISFNTGRQLVKAGTNVTLSANLPSLFKGERLIVSDHGPSENFVINDIRIDGKSQLTKSGALPGDMFKGTAIDNWITFPRTWRKAKLDVDIQYIGPEAAGRAFHGALLGRRSIGLLT